MGRDEGWGSLLGEILVGVGAADAGFFIFSTSCLMISQLEK